MIDFEGTEIPVEIDGEGETLIILAHGAGGSMTAKTILQLRDTLVKHGLQVARFNFAYKQQGKNMPDRMPKLVACYRAVADSLSSKTLICGGHSMGGRTASHLAAEKYPMDGLLLLSYPLHPPEKPDKLRVEHLPDIEVPTLCINGTNDEFCTPELMEKHRPTSNHWTMHWLEGGTHSYAVKGRKPAEVMEEIGSTTAEWAQRLSQR